MADKWIQKATANSHGQFKAKAHKAGMTTAEAASKWSSKPGLTGKQARLAANLMSLNKRSK